MSHLTVNTPVASLKPVVSLNAVTAGYGPSTVLSDFSLDIAAGEQVVIVGPSGSGKSTILRVITEQLRARSGHVSRPSGEVRVAVAGQAPLLFDWLNVAENIRLGRRFRPSTEVERSDEAIVVLGLTEELTSASTELSHEQAVRASLARALADRPELLLLDDPFVGLDGDDRTTAQLWLRQLLVADGITSLTVTDSLSDAFALADRVIVIGVDAQVLATLSLNHLNHSPELASV